MKKIYIIYLIPEARYFVQKIQTLLSIHIKGMEDIFNQIIANIPKIGGSLDIVEVILETNESKFKLNTKNFRFSCSLNIFSTY